ncbi:MAG: GatB/YqeY domain-containing protein [Myxococcales bacterium]|nr:GatB/YqeY domain-containing protein [Myxococcales bacterium]
MSLLAQLTEDLKTAMKAREKQRVSTVKLLLADLKKEQIDLKREHNEEETLAFLSKQVKRRHESIDAFTQGDRPELAEKEQAELQIIESYLPKQLSPEEAREIVQEAITSLGASSPKDIGKVMKEIMPKLKGRFPARDVKPLVDSLLPA